MPGPYVTAVDIVPALQGATEDQLFATQLAMQMPSTSMANALLKKLEAGKDAVLSFGSDSSFGTEQVGSPGPRLINAIAARYPGYRVVLKEWDINTTAYKADVVLQAGIGGTPPTLTVYLGAAPGFTIQYFMTNFAAMYPVAADLFISNFGYNQSEVVTPNPPNQPGYGALLLVMIRRVQAKDARTGIILVAQPPKKVGTQTDAAARDRHATLSLETIAVAAREGLGLADAFTAFLRVANYESQLIGPDGIHPLVAGYDVEFVVLLAQFPIRALGMPSAPRRSVDRIVVPPGGFTVVQGAPTTGYALEDQYFNRTAPVWNLGDAALHGLATWVALPDWWENFDLYILWSMVSAVAGAVDWTPNIKLVDIDTPAAAVAGAKAMTGFSSSGFGLPSGSFVTAVPGTRGLTKTKLVSGYALNRPNSGLLQATIFRRGDQAGDTATGNAELHSMVLERIK